MSDKPDPIKPDPEKKPKRPRDANQLAKSIVDLATGQAEEVDPDAGKDPAAVARGKAGGRARTSKLTPEERAAAAAKAARARWAKKKTPDESSSPELKDQTSRG